jgi:hypothetical protein
MKKKPEIRRAGVEGSSYQPHEQPDPRVGHVMI